MKRKARQAEVKGDEFNTDDMSPELKEWVDKQLTKYGMAVSEKSLAKDWEKEDDFRWNSFLKDKE